MYQKLLAESGFSMERLASFCQVADAGSIVATAKGDPTRQSLVSRQIRELESFFGVELVRRKGRGLELTENGRKLAAIGRQHFLGLSDFAAQCKGAPWTVKIVASNSVAHWLLLPRLNLVWKRFPNVQFEIHHEQTHEMVRATQEGTYDIAFVPEDSLGTELQSEKIGNGRRQLFLPIQRQLKFPIVEGFSPGCCFVVSALSISL